MTVDELVKLTNALLGGIELAHLRKGIDSLYIGDLPDDDYALLVRFLAGERPTGSDTSRPANRDPGPRQPSQELADQSLPDDEPEAPEPGVINVAIGRNERGGLVLGGQQFSGVELP